MVKVKKRSGPMQNFDKAKLEGSLEKAGAKEEHVTKVADTIAGKVREGMETNEIKRIATSELKGINPQAAQAYETFTKPAK